MEIKPGYYHQNGTDVIEMIRLLKGEQAAKDFCAGNVLKYTIRFEKKNGVEDLNKAKTYLNRLIELESGKEKNENTQIKSANDKTLEGMLKNV